jgi:hypothetical protein
LQEGVIDEHVAMMHCLVRRRSPEKRQDAQERMA